VSGRWCEPGRTATWSRSSKTPTGCNGVSSTRSWPRRFIEGDDFTIADIALGAYARRWFGVEGITKPALPHLERWFAQFAGRAGFQQFIAPPMS
jgi:glutathione S-transferase